MASSLESNRSRTCCRVSDELVHPMSGSTALGEACSKSSTHDLVLAVPDCIAVLAGLYMRAVVMNGGALWRISCVVSLAYRNRPGGQGGATPPPWRGGRTASAVLVGGDGLSAPLPNLPPHA